MTTFSDQPLSRRALREREAEAARLAAAASDAGVSNAADADAGADSASSSAQPVSAQPVSAQPVSAAPVAPAPSSAPPVVAEPLSYVTQGRAPLPQYDAPLAQPSLAPQTSEQPSTGDASGAPFRYRDFSPEGAARPGAWRAPQISDAADLQYRTQGRADVPVSAPSAEPVNVSVPESAPVPVSAPVPESEPASEPVSEPIATAEAHAEPVADAPVMPRPPEATMTRRELRAWRDAQASDVARQGHEPNPGDQPLDAAASHPPVSEAQVSQAPVSQAPVSQAPVWTPPASAPPVVDVPSAVSAAPVATPVEATFPPPLIEPEAPAADALASFEALFGSPTSAAPTTAEPSPAEPARAETASASPVAPAPVEQPWVPAPAPAPEQQQGAAPMFAPPSINDFAQSMQPPSPFDQTTVSAPSFVPNPHLQSVQPAPIVEPGPETPAPAFPTPSVASGAFSLPFEGGAAVDNAPAAALSIPASEPAPEHPVRTSQQPVVGERPRNHWSRQSEVDDLEQPNTGSLMRSVGAAPAANALVLPEAPNTDIITSAVGGTGDLIITGSISLPASLSSTGAHPTQLDESDLDSLLDPGDQQVTSTDSQPVRAIRAVSTHTSSRELIGTINPKRGNRALTALMISAAGMAVVVVTLLVVALTQGVLG